MGLRFSILVAAAASLSACATSPLEYSQGHGGHTGADKWQSVYPGADGAASLFTSLTGQAAPDFQVEETTVARVAIGGRGPRIIADHEAGAAAPAGAGKIDNLGLGVTPGTVLERTQNNLNDNGWRQGPDGYEHLPSGMACPNAIIFNVENEETGEKNSIPISLADIRLFDQFGRDTGCDYVNQDAGVYLTFFASEWPDTTLADHYGAALQNIVDRFPIASETPLVAMSFQDDAPATVSTIEGDTLTGAFLLEPDEGVILKTALWLNKTSDWHVKARATYVVAVEGAEPQFSVAEIYAAIFHAATLIRVDRNINASTGVAVSY